MEIADPKPTADRMEAEIKRSGSASQKCLNSAHAEAVAHDLNARGYTATADGDLVTAH
jgi:hypothetical protein